MRKKGREREGGGGRDRARDREKEEAEERKKRGTEPVLVISSRSRSPWKWERIIDTSWRWTICQCRFNAKVSNYTMSQRLECRIQMIPATPLQKTGPRISHRTLSSQDSPTCPEWIPRYERISCRIEAAWDILSCTIRLSESYCIFFYHPTC